VQRAGRDGLTLVTTEKDLARLSGEEGLDALARAAKPLPVRLTIREAVAFGDLVLAAARQ
jgi:tetraacyldisaccharide 4'-kinase